MRRRRGGEKEEDALFRRRAYAQHLIMLREIKKWKGGFDVQLEDQFHHKHSLLNDEREKEEIDLKISTFKDTPLPF